MPRRVPRQMQRCGVPSRLEFCFGARRRQQSLRIGPPPNFFPGVENEQAEAAEAAADYLGSISPNTMLGVHLCIHSRGARIEMKPEPREGDSAL